MVVKKCFEDLEETGTGKLQGRKYFFAPVVAFGANCCVVKSVKGRLSLWTGMAGGEIFMGSGKGKSIGEMLLAARTPVQLAPVASGATGTCTQNHFQFTLTNATVRTMRGTAATILGPVRMVIGALLLQSLSRRNRRTTSDQPRQVSCFYPFSIYFIGVVLLLFPPRSRAETNSFAARAERAFADARQVVRHEPSNSIAATAFAHAAFDWAEFAAGDEQRERIAVAGIKAARDAISLSSTNAAAHYWLGMNLGQLARTKLLGALKIVREMEEEFLRARALDLHVDYAGPDRTLGHLYRDAPGWPTSIGDKTKAREHLERALELHPEYPENQLTLLESFEEWADKKNFERQLPIAEKALTNAHAKFIGEMWEASWADWNKRLAGLKARTHTVGHAAPGRGIK